MQEGSRVSYGNQPNGKQCTLYVQRDPVALFVSFRKTSPFLVIRQFIQRELIHVSTGHEFRQQKRAVYAVLM